MAKRVVRGSRRGGVVTKVGSVTYRSRFEASVAQCLERDGIAAEYETNVLNYEMHYIPDFVLKPACGRVIYVEVKGYFPSADRTKMAAVARFNPELDIRFVFSTPHRRIGKGTMTYAIWAERHGFMWSADFVPSSWVLDLDLGVGDSDG